MEDTAYHYLDEERKKLWEELRRTQTQLATFIEALTRLSTFASKTPAVAGVLLIGLHLQSPGIVSTVSTNPISQCTARDIC